MDAPGNGNAERFLGQARFLLKRRPNLSLAPAEIASDFVLPEEEPFLVSQMAETEEALWRQPLISVSDSSWGRIYHLDRVFLGTEEGVFELPLCFSFARVYGLQSPENIHVDGERVIEAIGRVKEAVDYIGFFSAEYGAGKNGSGFQKLEVMPIGNKIGRMDRSPKTKP